MIKFSKLYVKNNHFFMWISVNIIYLIAIFRSTNIIYCATREKKFILRVWSLMPEESEGNKHTSKMNVFSTSHTIYFLLGSQKMDLFDSHGAIKSILW